MTHRTFSLPKAEIRFTDQGRHRLIEAHLVFDLAPDWTNLYLVVPPENVAEVEKTPPEHPFRHGLTERVNAGVREVLPQGVEAAGKRHIFDLTDAMVWQSVDFPVPHIGMPSALCFSIDPVFKKPLTGLSNHDIAAMGAAFLGRATQR